jgi:hypothetical protein
MPPVARRANAASVGRTAGGETGTRSYIRQFGERDGTRTHDLQIKSPLLYQLSYAPVGAKTALRSAAEHRDAAGAGQPEIPAVSPHFPPFRARIARIGNFLRGIALRIEATLTRGIPMKKPAPAAKTGKSKALEANTGAGPAIAARSKDAKAPAKAASQKTGATKSDKPKAATKAAAPKATSKSTKSDGAVSAKPAGKSASTAKSAKASPKPKTSKASGIAAAPAAIAKGASAVASGVASAAGTVAGAVVGAVLGRKKATASAKKSKA